MPVHSDNEVYQENINLKLVVSNMTFIFPYISGIIIPTDFHIFQRGRSTTDQIFNWENDETPHWICGDPMFSGARIQIIAKTRDHHVHWLSCA